MGTYPLETAHAVLAPQVAGHCALSVVAVLLSVGYRADPLYRPDRLDASSTHAMISKDGWKLWILIEKLHEPEPILMC